MGRFARLSVTVGVMDWVLVYTLKITVSKKAGRGYLARLANNSTPPIQGLSGNKSLCRLELKTNNPANLLAAAGGEAKAAHLRKEE